MRRTVPILAVLAPWPGDALAGAWTQPEGEGQVIVSGSVGVAPFTGFQGDVGDTGSSFTSLFFEYGMIEGLTVGGTAFVEMPSDDADPTANAGIFLRKRLWQGEAGDVASVQVGYVQPLDDLFGDGFGGPDAHPTHELSLRALYGRGFGGDWGSAFVSLEGGYHAQLDGADDEIRADVTAGYAPYPCCLGMLSFYSTVPLGDMDDAAVKLAPSFAYTFNARDPSAPEPGEDADVATPFTLQIGVSQDLLNLDDGFGVQTSIWRPF